MLVLLSFTWWNCSQSPWSEPAIWCREGLRPKYLSWLRICMTAFWMKTESSFRLSRNCSSVLGRGRREDWLRISREMFSLLESRNFREILSPSHRTEIARSSLTEITLACFHKTNYFARKVYLLFWVRTIATESFAKDFIIGTQVFPSPWLWALYPSLCSSSLKTLGSTHQWTLLLWTIAIVLVLRNF